MELGAGQLLADVIAGALRKCRDRLLTRQLENPWNAITEEAVRFFRG